MKKILITGATGFIGSTLIKRLRQERKHLAAAVLDGEDISHLPKNLERIVVPPLSEFCDYSAALVNVDVVVHLAARVHIMHDHATDPLNEFRKINFYGTLRLAQQAVNAGVKRFVFISTVKVHGEGSTHALLETDTFAPQDPYAISKMEAEQSLLKIASESGLEVVILRPVLVYGPGVRANFLNLLKIVNRGIPLPIASIQNHRSLIYLGNLVDAIAVCATHPQAPGHAFLVSDGEDCSTPELIKHISIAMGKKVLVFPFPNGLMLAGAKILGKAPAIDRLFGSLYVDSSKIRNELAWIPPYNLKEGIRQTVEWYKSI